MAAALTKFAKTLLVALREQQAVGEDADCFGLDSTGVEVHPDATGAKKNGPRSISKSRAGAERRSTSSRLVTASSVSRP